MAEKITDQIKFWTGNFGAEYNKRNSFNIEELDRFYVHHFGISRMEMNRIFINSLNRDIRILEVGCNNGQQLRHLQQMGFKNLYGIEIQQDAIALSKEMTRNINIIEGSAFDIPFKDGWFDLVFTSGVLIHISPNDLPQALMEMHRVTKKFIWGFEYFSDEMKEIEYRGNKGFLWKQNFSKLFCRTFADIKPVREEKYKYLQDENYDMMFLLEKK